MTASIETLTTLVADHETRIRALQAACSAMMITLIADTKKMDERSVRALSERLGDMFLQSPMDDATIDLARKYLETILLPLPKSSV
jgi:hypothetical protein